MQRSSFARPNKQCKHTSLYISRDAATTTYRCAVYTVPRQRRSIASPTIRNTAVLDRAAAGTLRSLSLYATYVPSTAAKQCESRLALFRMTPRPHRGPPPRATVHSVAPLHYTFVLYRNCSWKHSYVPHSNTNSTKQRHFTLHIVAQQHKVIPHLVHAVPRQQLKHRYALHAMSLQCLVAPPRISRCGAATQNYVTMRPTLTQPHIETSLHATPVHNNT